MDKHEMIALRKALGTIRTTDGDTITMANCLQFLDQKIEAAAITEEAQKLAIEKAKPKKKA